MSKAYLEPDEVKKLEEAAQYTRDKLLIRLLFHLGCRISEALALEVKDINLESASATIQHLKARLHLSCPKCKARLGKSHAFCPGCGEKVEKALTQEKERRRMRTLPLDPESLEMLRSYLERGGPVKYKEKILLFGINRHRAWQIIKECAGRAGLGPLLNTESGKVHGVSPHRLRDAFAVHAVKIDDSGDGLRLLQEHLGHASFDTTARYRKVSGQELREWHRKLWPVSEEKLSESAAKRGGK